MNLSGTEIPGTPSLSLSIAIAAVPAIAAVLAAIIAARSARRATAAQAETDRLRHLEERVAGQKYEVYRPMLELLQDMLNPELAEKVTNQAGERIAQFATWIAIFGSDEAVVAYRNFMQASFHNAPPTVAIRLYGDLFIAARRDMGDPKTQLSATDVMAIRINDIYETEMVADTTLPLTELFAKYGWQAPWLQLNANSTGSTTAAP
jgi:hypothetical protein